MKVLVQSLRAVLVLTVVTGVLYPAAVLAVGRVLFKDRSLGSRVYNAKHELVGSSLIAQGFTRPGYVWPRPSANGYDATNSGGSNVSPVGADAVAKVTSERLRLEEANPEAKGEPPLLLLTASGSGLDPHLSPEAALWQAERIAKARGRDVAVIRRIIEDSVEPRTFGILGEPRVNVLEVNRRLDESEK